MKAPAFSRKHSVWSSETQIPSCLSQPHPDTEFQTNLFSTTKINKQKPLLAFPYMILLTKCQSWLDFYWSFVTEASVPTLLPQSRLPYLLTVLSYTTLGRKWKWGSYLWAGGFTFTEREQTCKTQAERKAK